MVAKSFEVRGSKLIVFLDTISLVANKLGKNMLVFAEDFSYSQDDKKVLLSKAKNNKIYVIPKSNKK